MPTAPGLGQAPTIISIHFDGDIVTDHRVSIRTLGKTLTHLQRSIDRAYLDIERQQGVRKYARIKREEYRDSLFFVGEPSPGGYILDFIQGSTFGIRIIDRITNAIRPAFQRISRDGIIESESLRDQVLHRKVQLVNNLIEPRTYQNMLDVNAQETQRRYGDRSIVKEMNQILSIIRSEAAGESSFDITLRGTHSANFAFNKALSTRFNDLVGKRNLGLPVSYTGQIRSLDNVNLTGKFINSETNFTSNLIIADRADFLQIHPYSDGLRDITFIGSPLVEYDSYDPNSGDIYFLKLITQNGPI